MATIPTSAEARGDHGSVGEALNPEVPEGARVRHFSAEYKLRILAEYESLDRPAKGGLLRREALYMALTSEWFSSATRGPCPRYRRSWDGQRSAPRGENARLRRENQWPAEELEKAQHVIRLQGQLSALLKALASESSESESEHGR